MSIAGPLTKHTDLVRRTCGVTGDRSYRLGPKSAVDLQRAYQAAISNHSNGDCR